MTKVTMDCIPFMHLTAQMVPKLKITTYYDTGNEKNLFTLGTRVLLTCDVSELTEGNEAVSYRWYHNCTEVLNRRCEIRDREPYYRVVNDTLLVDVTSWDQGGRYSCFVTFSITPGSTSHSSITVAGWLTVNTCNRQCGTYIPFTITLPQVTLFPSSTPPPLSSLRTLSSLMYNRQQGGMDNSG